MRNIVLITCNGDLDELSQQLERAGFAVAEAAAADLYEPEVVPQADAAILDLRRIPAATRSDVVTVLGDCAMLVVALVDETHLDLIAPHDSCEDFIVLPASPGEVGRRLERAIWRRHGIDNENRVNCGALQIDLANYRVTVGGEPVVLTYKEYELLRFLALNVGRVFTREQLLSRVWGYDYFGGARTVDVHIRRIRSKVESYGHTFIETVRNVGYRLVVPAGARGNEQSGNSESLREE